MLKKALSLLLCLTLALPVWAADDFLLADIQIEGARRVKVSDVLGAMSLRVGQMIDVEDVDAAIQAIYRLGRFSDIAVEAEEVPNGKLLRFLLTERPLVRNVSFTGNDELDDAKLREVVKLRVPDIYDPYKVAQSVEAIKEAYVKEGYYAARVSADSQVNAENESTVVFTIDEGPLVRIKEIRFSGNSRFSAGELRKAMEIREKWMLSWLTGRGNYDELLLEQDLERIADLYYNVGHVRVKVRKPVISLIDGSKHMLLLINIEEGPQFKIGKIEAQGDLLQEKQSLVDLSRLQSGDVFSRDELRQAVGRVSDLYADRGYAYVNVAPLTRVNEEERTIDVMLDIEQGPQVSVERINITGNTKTRDKVIRREIKLIEGELYNASAMKRSKGRINNLGYFEAVDITTSEGSAPEWVDINVNVKERPTGTFSIGAGFSSVEGFVGQGSMTQENFLGRGLKMNLAASLGGESTTYQVGLTDPYFLDTRWVLGFELYKTEREWTDFSRKVTGGALKGGHPIGEYSRLLLVYRYDQKEIYDVEPFASRIIREQEGKSNISSLTTIFSRNTTDDRLDPSRGGVLELSWEYAGLGGDEKFSKYVLDYRHFWPVFLGTVFSVHGNIGYAHETGGEEVPIDERFFLGGINSLRGFDSREVGPRDPLTGDFTGGDLAAYANIEYIFPILPDVGIKGVAFFDIGNAWDSDVSSFDDWRYSVGAGIRWRSPLGPLRLEWGYNLDPEPWEPDSRFEFMIGRFF
ncbi:MAG: outer membrane protein assembly factor BamA [Desulfuromonadales bacterium]|nr:outer membrane protein assembly factor BamA [Desulfuromonadales bacterium]